MSTIPQPAPEAAPPPATPAKGNALAIAGFAIASAALLLCLIPIVNNFAAALAILGLVFGAVGLIRARGRRRPHRGLSIAAIILAVTAFAGVLVSQAFYSDAVDDVSKSLDEVGSGLESDLDRMAGESTEKILESDLTVDIGPFDVTTDEGGFMESSLAVKLTNKADEEWSYDVSIEAVDSSGDRIAEDWASSNSLEAGQSESFELFTLVPEEDVKALESAKFRVY